MELGINTRRAKLTVAFLDTRLQLCMSTNQVRQGKPGGAEMIDGFVGLPLPSPLSPAVYPCPNNHGSGSLKQTGHAEIRF